MKLPYGRQWIEEEDIRAVSDVLRSRMITTGPQVEAFERAVAQFVEAKSAVAVSSGTAALHSAMYAAGVSTGDEVIVPTLTFAATANAVIFQGGTPVFADVDKDTLLIDPDDVEAKITSHTKAIVAVDYAGQPCEYDRLQSIADGHDLVVVSDACHALGAEYNGRKVGTVADLTVFSFHPVKHITTGEGGMAVTNDDEYAAKMRRFRNHGIAVDHRQRESKGSWFYEITDLGYNYRLTDFQCALGISQLRRLPKWLDRRRTIARSYDVAFARIPAVNPLVVREDVLHSYHLYVIRLDFAHLSRSRAEVFADLRSEGIGVNVHYIPLHLQPFYRQRFATEPGMCPVAEEAYSRIISLPMFPRMSDKDVEDVISAVQKALSSRNHEVSRL